MTQHSHVVSMVTIVVVIQKVLKGNVRAQFRCTMGLCHEIVRTSLSEGFDCRKDTH